MLWRVSCLIRSCSLCAVGYGFCCFSSSSTCASVFPWEITKAAHDIALEVAEGKLKAEDISEETLSEHMATAFMPDPELLIRTGGEERISNYLLWQIAYSELYFTETYWPDFDEEDLHKAIISYQSRQRRFGKTEKQIENENQQG